MNEERWGDEWNVGDRIRYSHPDPNRMGVVEGTIKDRRWGVDEGIPIWHFTVVADGEKVKWIVDPRHIQPATGAELSIERTIGQDNNKAVPQPPTIFDPEPVVNKTSELLEYPVPHPEKTGFGPIDTENAREWREDKAKWMKEHRL